MNKASKIKPIRAVGYLSVTAIALNGMIGSGIFVLPSTVAASLGQLSPIAYITSAIAAVLIVLCFAEVGSMYERSGGPYVYAKETFGDFVGFEVGWMFMLARVTAIAAISNAFADYLGEFWPSMAVGAGRVEVITLAILALAWINILGVRYGAWVINLLTMAKLIPLLLFLMVGWFFIEPGSYSLLALPEFTPLARASLVLIFAFGGFEFATVPSEEVINPRRNIPVALITAVSSTALFYLLIQIVALGTLPDLGSSARPLAAAAGNFLGPAGVIILTIGAILSTSGTNSAVMLIGPRMLYALASDGHLPGALARLHPRYRTPHISVIVFAVSAWAMALYSDFAQLATVSAIARLLYYITTCLAVPILRRKFPNSPRMFRLPGGVIIPALAVAISVWLLSGSTAAQATVGAGALILGAAIYKVIRLMGRR